MGRTAAGGAGSPLGTWELSGAHLGRVSSATAVPHVRGEGQREQRPAGGRTALVLLL